MCSHVHGQVAGLGKTISTLRATIRFFSSVCSHVSLQAACNEKSVSTLLATVKFFSSVCSLVPGQGAGLWKSFSTHLATIRFFSSVCSHVHGQVVRTGNFFPHSWQQCCFLSKWIFMCSLKYEFCVKHFPPWWQQNCFVACTVFVCLIDVIFLTKHCPISWQFHLSVNLSRVMLGNNVAWRSDFLLRFKHNKLSSAKILVSSIWLGLFSLESPHPLCWEELIRRLHQGTSNFCCLFNVFLLFSKLFLVGISLFVSTKGDEWSDCK